METHTTSSWGLPARCLHVVKTLLVLSCCLPQGGATVMVFTVFDVFAELESWGRITVGRFNASTSGSNGWPIPPEVTSHNSQTMEITEIRLLNDKGQWVKSHRFDSNERNFAVSNWETDTYDFRRGSFRAHARRIETIRLGELSGQLNMAVYIATEDARLGASDDDDVAGGGDVVNVTRGDVELVLEFVNVTEGCRDCRTLEVVVSFWGHAAARGQGSRSDGSEVTEKVMLPGGTQIWLPHSVLLDGNISRLYAGSPAFEQWDSALMTTLCMPIFNTSASYSAMLRVGGESTAHLIAERPVHKVYGEDDHTDTVVSPIESTESPEKTTVGEVEVVEKEKDKDKGEWKSEKGNNVTNPEYRHVKDSPVTGGVLSAASAAGVNFVTLVVSIVLAGVVDLL